MIRSMFAAISGLKAHQTMLDVTSNDIANVNTVGYKSSRATFKDALSQTQRGASAPGIAQGGANASQVGLGVSLGSIDNLMGSGSLQSTGNALDVAIQGDGWFRTGAGTPPALPATFEYTRAGNFTLNTAGNLTTRDGQYVMGKATQGTDAAADAYINVPATATNVSIGSDGSVNYVDGGVAGTAGYLTVAKFANEAGLERSSNNRWRGSVSSGAELRSTPGTIAGGYGSTISGVVEMSNVDLATQFTTMITAQRGFQANSRIISASDELLQDLVNMKR